MVASGLENKIMSVPCYEYHCLIMHVQTLMNTNREKLDPSVKVGAHFFYASLFVLDPENTEAQTFPVFKIPYTEIKYMRLKFKGDDVHSCVVRAVSNFSSLGIDNDCVGYVVKYTTAVLQGTLIFYYV